MLEKYHKLQLKPKTTDELKVALQTIWEELPREHINKTAANFSKCLTADMAVAANGGHFEHLQYLCLSPSRRVKVKVTGGKKVENPYAHNVKLRVAITSVL